MLSNTEFFFTYSSTSASSSVGFYKYTFGNANPDWKNKMTCSTGTCSTGYSESQKSGTTIYNFFIADSSYYLYLASFDVPTGNLIGSRYKSSITLGNVYGSALMGNYLLATVTTNIPFLYYVLMYNIATNTFTLRVSSSITLYQCGVESSTGRFIIFGSISGGNAYISIYNPDSFLAHPNFSSLTATMDVLPIGTDDIVSDATVVTITSSPSTVTSGPLATQAGVFNFISSYSNYFGNSDQTITLSENNISIVAPDVACSIDSSTTITYGLADYNPVQYPAWVSIDSSTGLLTIMSPNVTSDTTVSFYITSTFSISNTTPVKKVVKIVVLNCVLLNCQRCSISSNLICDQCDSGYVVNAGLCQVQSSAQTTNSSKYSSKGSNRIGDIIKFTIVSVLSVTSLLVIGSHVTNDSSMASLWSLINQVQIFFLLLITNAFIPDSVQRIIKGLEFTLNYPNEIPFTEITVYKSFINKFNIKLSNQSLNSLGIYSDSTFYNSNKFFILQILMCLFTAFIYFLWILLSRCREEGHCKRPILILKWCVSKTYLFMTFGYYIRTILEMTQILLISSINEVYRANTLETLDIVSFIIAILILSAFILLNVFIFYLALSPYRVEEDEHNKFGELFSGIKMKSCFKLYCFIMQMRKTIYIIVLIVLTSISSKFLIGILSVLQIFYSIYVIFLRPYIEVKCNVIEILNEICFIILLILLIFWNTENDWTDMKASIYMWIISSNNILSFCIVLIDALRIRISKCLIKRRKANYINTNLMKIIPKTPTQNISAIREEFKEDQINKGSNIDLSINQLREERKVDISKYPHIKIMKMRMNENQIRNGLN